MSCGTPRYRRQRGGGIHTQTLVQVAYIILARSFYDPSRRSLVKLPENVNVWDVLHVYPAHRAHLEFWVQARPCVLSQRAKSTDIYSAFFRPVAVTEEITNGVKIIRYNTYEH